MSKSNNILRKMDPKETFFLFFKDNEHVIRLFKMSSKIDYFQYKDLFKQAVHKWISIHPLLNAKIEQIESDYYFVKIESNNNDYVELENIKFLTIDSESNNNNYNTIIDLIIENESFNKIDLNNKLWRLTLIRSNDNNNDFDIIFTIHHSITEGRNVIYIFQQLLSIFEDLHVNKETKLESYKILPGRTNLFQKAGNSTDLILTKNETPSFLSIDEAKSIETTNQKYKDYLNVIINSDTSKLSIIDLIETAKLNQLKFKFITLNQDDSIQLFEKLKQYKVKLQPFLNILFAMTFQRVYQTFGNEKEINRNIILHHTINLRQYHKDVTIFGENINERMGFYTNSFFYLLKKKITLDNFWILVQNETNEMLSRIQKNEHIPKENDAELFSKIKPSELFLDSMTSNLGIFSNNETLQKIKMCFVNVKGETSDMNFKRFSFNNLITIDNRLHWSFIYNSFLVREQLASFIVDLTLENIKTLIK
jgi:hypothetical protein